MRKTTVKVICFGLILVCTLNYTNKVFKVKNNIGISECAEFYELKKNSVDVLVLGSSHAFMDINTGTLWDEYGMATYVFAGAAQPMWNTYYYLKEALKYQRPKLIVLEAYTVFDGNFQKDAWVIANNYGLKWSKDKIDSVMLSAPEERWGDFFLEYTQYHTRYRELSRKDFSHEEAVQDIHKGFICMMNTTPCETPNVAEETERGDICEKVEKYYRMTIELAQSENIPIMVVVSPYAEINVDKQKIYNTAGDIAGEYGVPFINYNVLLDEMGLDFSKDAADTNHLNYRGSQKYAKVLGAYIVENFDIPDRRGNSDYQTWQDNADKISVKIENQILRETTNIREMTDKISKSNYVLIASAEGNCQFAEEELYDFYSVMGISQESGYSGIYYMDNDKGTAFHVNADGEKRYVRLDPHDLCMMRGLDEAGTAYKNKIIIDRTEYGKVKNGVNVVVYDKVTRSVADSFGIDKDNAYSIVR